MPDLTSPDPDIAALKRELGAIVREANQPLVERVSKLESKFDSFDDRYYRREMVDQMVKGIKDEVGEIRDLIRQQRDSVLKVLGAIATIAGLFVLFAQHISIH